MNKIKRTTSKDEFNKLKKVKMDTDELFSIDEI